MIGKKIIAIIPARKGSKRIKNKNLIKLNGIPLINHTIEHAINSKLLSEIYISTNCERIKSNCKKFPVKIMDRPANISKDKSSSELAILDVLEKIKSQGDAEPEYIVMLQCTSPIRKGNDIDNAIRKIKKEKANSLMSVTDFRRFIWTKKGEKFLPINYNYESRKRTQDINKQYIENGSIYITKVTEFRKKKK